MNLPKYSLQLEVIPLSVANSRVIPVGLAEYCFIRSIDNLNSNLNISFDGNVWLPARVGSTFDFGIYGDTAKFDKIWIKNNAVTGGGFAVIEFLTGIKRTEQTVAIPDIISLGLLQQAVTVAATATLIPATALTGRTILVIANNSGVTVYLGTSTVTTANGFPLLTGQSFVINISEFIKLYGIVAAGTAAISILEGA